jgi:hypothetical protein
MSADVDLFAVYRWLLAIVCTVYAALQLGRTVLSWAAFFWEPAAHRDVLRHYAEVQLLRVRLRRFGGSLFQIAALACALLGMLWLHRWLGYVG